LPSVELTPAANAAAKARWPKRWQREKEKALREKPQFPDAL
jgi:hypothetical protein